MAIFARWQPTAGICENFVKNATIANMPYFQAYRIREKKTNIP